jgi:hypothetical protein
LSISLPMNAFALLSVHELPARRRGGVAAASARIAGRSLAGPRRC